MAIGTLCLQRVGLLEVCGKVVIERKVDPYLPSFMTELGKCLIFRGHAAFNVLSWETFWKRPIPNDHFHIFHLDNLRSIKTLILVAVLNPQFKTWIKKREAILEAFALSQLDNQQVFEWYRNLVPEDREFVRLMFPDDFRSLSAANLVSMNITSRRLRMLLVLTKMNSWERQWNDFNSLPRRELQRISDLHDLRNVVNIRDIFNEIRIQPHHVTYPARRNDIPALSKWYFPPCIVSILDRLKQHGDIRPTAAMQLMDFCNDIGLSRQDILTLVETLAQEARNGARECRVSRHAPQYMEALLGLEGSERQAGDFMCKSMEEKAIGDGPDVSGGCYFRQVVRFENQLKEDLNAAHIPQRRVAQIETFMQTGKCSQACGTHVWARYKNLGSAPMIFTPADYYCHARRMQPTIPDPEKEQIVDIEDLDILIRPWRNTPRSCNRSIITISE